MYPSLHGNEAKYDKNIIEKCLLAYTKPALPQFKVLRNTSGTENEVSFFMTTLTIDLNKLRHEHRSPHFYKVVMVTEPQWDLGDDDSVSVMQSFQRSFGNQSL